MMKMGMRLMAEDKFENAVIAKLQDEGWDYRKDLSNKNTDVLYQHWRDIINRNNRIKLENKLLSDDEFQSLNFINEIQA